MCLCSFCSARLLFLPSPRQLWELENDADTGLAMVCPTVNVDIECRQFRQGLGCLFVVLLLG